MRADYPVLLDACVLVPANLCDLLLNLAESPRLYLPYWSDKILAEVNETQLVKLNWPKHLAKHWQESVRGSFPEAMVTGYENLLNVCENEEKDKHVLAAAIKCNAGAIVTSNLKHFPRSALERWEISALHPSDFLTNLYSMESGVVVSKIESIARRRKRPPEEILARLGKSVPGFVEKVVEDLAWDLTDV